jgi:DNA helicase-2/ATP-dependent DNA helicase PcrA
LQKSFCVTEYKFSGPYARQNAQGDRHVYASRTRFIPDRLLNLFEKTTWPLPTVGTAARSASQGPRINVGARMRGMWR